MTNITTKGGYGGRVIERECWLPTAPEVLEAQLKQLLGVTKLHGSTVAKFCILIDELFHLPKRRKAAPGTFAVGNKYAEQIVCRVAGRRPLAILDSLGLTEIIKPHRATINPSATVRRFTHSPESFKPRRLTLRGKAMQRALQSGMRGKQRRAKDPVFSWVQESLERASLHEHDLIELERIKNSIPMVSRWRQGERPQKWKGSYRWNVVCQFPSETRKRLIFDECKPVACLDISSAFPTMLPWLVKDDLLHRLRKGSLDQRTHERSQTELDRLRVFLSSDDFYTKLAPPGSTRKSAKSAFQQFLNGADSYPLLREIGSCFKNQFPYTASMIGRRRRSARKAGRKATIADELQGRLNETMIRVIVKCRGLKIPCIPICDELIAPFEDRANVLDIMHREVEKDTGVRAKIGGVRLQDRRPSTVKCPPGLCPDCWENRVVSYLGSPFPCSHQEGGPSRIQGLEFIPRVAAFA